MGRIITQCPSCSSIKLHVVKIDCENCETKFEGKFDIPLLLKLPEDDLQFIIDFVKCSGSLKEMAKLQNVSYPTLRNHLNQLIESIELIESKSDLSRINILRMLDEGSITAEEAVKRLKKI